MSIKTFLGLAAASAKTVLGLAIASVKAVDGLEVDHNALIACDAADFDGTNDYMLRGGGLTGAADSKQGLLSVWFRLDGGDATNLRILASNNGRWRADRLSDNKLYVIGVNSALATVLSIATSGTYVASGTWRHLLAGWDVAVAGSGHLYVTDVADYVETTFSNDTLDYTHTDWAVGATTTGGTKFNGALAEVYFAPGQYLDISVEANRRKFVSAAGKPINLGSDGSLPTGTAPLVYQHLDEGEAVANFATNRGSGGNFTITGTLETASTSPSD